MKLRVRTALAGLLVLGVPVAMLAAGTSAQAASPSVLSTSVLTASAPATAVLGASVNVTGSLTSGGVALPAAPLTVTRTVLGTPTTLTPTATDGSGNYSISDIPPSGGAFTYTVSFTADATHGAATATASVAVSLTPAGTFTGVKPARLLDTRPGHHTTDGLFAGIGALGSGGSLALQVSARGGVPGTSGVSAVVLNVTATGSTTGGYLTAYPSGSAPPNASSLNFAAGATVANLVTVKVGSSDGKVMISNHFGSTNVIVDVVGFYSTAAGPSGFAFHTQTPSRVMDTRLDTLHGPLGPNEYAYINYPQKAGDPLFDVRAVALNITVVKPQTGGYISVIPATSASPVTTNTSNLNYGPGQTVSNMAIVATAPYSTGSGAPTLETFLVANVSPGSANVIVDQVGWYDLDEHDTGMTFTPMAPKRILDTRTSTGNHLGRIGSGVTVNVPSSTVGSLTTGSLVMNVTAVNGTAPTTYLKLWAAGGIVPPTSNLGVTGAQAIANMAMVGVDGTAGRNFSVFNYAGLVNVIADVAGSFDTLVLPGSVRTAARAPGVAADSPAGAAGAARLRL